MYSILCDFDGTLVKDDGQLEDSYVDTLRDICNNNHFFISSSSTFNDLLNFKNKYNLNISIFSLSSNIMMIDNEIIYKGIPNEIIKTLINLFNRNIYTAYSESENDTLIYRYQERLDFFYPKLNRKIITTVDTDRPSFTFAISNDASDKFYQKIKSLNLGYKSLGKEKSRELIIIYLKPISKSDIYYYIKNKYGDEKIIGISDSIFDYDMFEKCDIKIAMLNSDQELKNRSDIITEYDNNNSGAIKALYNICHLK